MTRQSISGNTPTHDNSPFLWLPPSQQHKYTFPASIFVSDSFSANDFVQEFRSRVDNLDTLKQELAQFHHFLKEETISIIHRDYNAFIEFSGQLESIKDQVDQVKSSLPQVKESMQQFSSLVDTIVTQCSVQQTRVKNAQKKREQATFLLHVHTQLDLLSKEYEQTGTDGESLIAIAKQLQHVRSQLDTVIQHSHSQDPQLVQFCAQCEEQWSTTSNKIQQSLQTVLLGTDSELLLTHCLEAFSVCKKQRDVELLLEEKWMRPILDSLHVSNKRNIQDPKDTLYGPLLDAIHERFELLLRVSTSDENYERLGFEFLNRTILPVLCQQLQENKNLYEYRDKVRFHEQYLAQHNFFMEIEQRYIQTIDQLDLFRQSESLQALSQKWQLKIYFMLIKQEIAKEFETTCSQAQKQKKNDTQEITFPVLLQCWNLLFDQLFTPKVFIYRLTHDFLNLYIRMLSRLQKWVLEYITNSSVEDSATLLAQLYLLRDLIQTKLLSKVQGQFSEPILETCRKVIQESADRLLLDPKQVLQPIGEKIVQHYASQCSTAFANLGKKISVARSMHSTAATHSQYVVQILPSLIQFTKKFELAEVKTWTKEIIEIVIRNYLNVCQEFLEMDRKMNESLKKLRNQSNSGAGDTTRLSQLQLDVAELTKLIQQNFPYIKLEEISSFGELTTLA